MMQGQKFEGEVTNMNILDQGERRVAKGKTLVALLAEERKRQGLSQYDMADRMQTQQPSIARMERENHDPHLSYLERYAQGLQKKITWILEDA
jgi:ribosome-binding protein aMBF1 (putative translation factor)